MAIVNNCKPQQNGFPRAATLIMALILMLVLTSCENGNTERPAAPNTTTPEGISDYSFVYPTDPAQELQAALKKAVAGEDLPISVSEVEFITFDKMDQAKFTLQFSKADNNACVITFDLKSTPSDDDLTYDLDGHDNPSFVMAFKDTENIEDLKTVLVLVLKYLSPELAENEARRLAENQDTTTSVDGYSQPLDIGGYQVVTRCTNPQLFVRTKDFDSSLGIEVTALKQIWGDVDIGTSTAGYPRRGNDNKNKSVHADFIVKNVWPHEEWVHGDYWTEVDVESMDGDRYTLRLETMHMTHEYNFGVGQKYTIFIHTGNYYGDQINYAVQQSEVGTPNERGVPHEMDYPNPNHKDRVEPKGGDTVYDVVFELISHSIGDAYAAREGEGIGSEQWPHDPIRNNYEFIGWFDNKDGTGKPYTKDTPISGDTILYAKWKYTGNGGIWPRANHGELQGIEDGAGLTAGKELTITAAGYNMKIETPQDQRFRWKPVTWRLSDDKIGSFTAHAPFQTTIVFENEGEQQLYITYSEEIFDGLGWQSTGESCEVLENMMVG